MDPYKARRARAASAMSDGTVILPSAKLIVRNGDSTFGFRQESDFYYLTGFSEPEAVLLLAPKHNEHRSILFLRERDREREIWDGDRLGVERAVAALGVDAAFPIAELSERLPEYLRDVSTVYHEVGNDLAIDRVVLDALAATRERTRQKGKTPHAFVDPHVTIAEMRLIKESNEIATLRAAAAITRRGFVAGIRATRPGRFEYEIQSVIEAEYRRAGAQGVAYESIVGTGDNATTLHYVRNRDRLENGQLLLVDSGCELDFYASDVTRTWPVNGRFTPEQRAIYDVVLTAQEAAIAEVRPGAPRDRFHDAAARAIVEGLLDIGLLSGSVEENIEQKLYRKYFMHGTGHWLGLDVHDAGAYRDGTDEPVKFQPGMVTTVEPGVYVRRDLDCDQRFKGIGVRIEDDILVTQDGNENLTAAIPKDVDELVTIVGADFTAATA